VIPYCIPTVVMLIDHLHHIPDLILKLNAFDIFKGVISLAAGKKWYPFHARAI